MSCERTKEALSAWIDGELARDEATAVEEHLAACACCRAVAEDLRAIVGAAPALGATPAEDGWPRLERELVQRRGARRWLAPSLAAAALLLATLGVVLALRERGEDPAEARARLELARLQEQQERTLRALQEVVKRQRAGWDERLRDTYARSAALVDAALAECRHAVSQRPTDLTLRARMTEAYQRKVEFLTLFSGLEEPGERGRP
jgi:hypothetical protein